MCKTAQPASAATWIRPVTIRPVTIRPVTIVSFLMFLFFLYISFLFIVIVAQTCMMTNMVTCYTEWKMLTLITMEKQSIITAYFSTIIIHLKNFS